MRTRALAVIGIHVVVGCTASGDTVLPPTDQLFGPTGVAVSPDNAVLFVTNGNSELRYNTGTISVFDLQRIDEAIAAWSGSDRVVPREAVRMPSIARHSCATRPYS